MRLGLGSRRKRLRREVKIPVDTERILLRPKPSARTHEIIRKFIEEFGNEIDCAQRHQSTSNTQTQRRNCEILKLKILNFEIIENRKSNLIPWCTTGERSHRTNLRFIELEFVV